MSNGVTNSVFYSLVQILAVLDQPWTLNDENNVELPTNDDPLSPGRYYIITEGEVSPTLRENGRVANGGKGTCTVSNELLLTRAPSQLSTATPYAGFHDAAVAVLYPNYGTQWGGFHETHGPASPPPTYSHWPTRGIGLSTILDAGLRS